MVDGYVLRRAYKVRVCADRMQEISSSIESYHTDNLIHIFYIIFALQYSLRWGDAEFRKAFNNLLSSDQSERPD